MHTHRRLTEGMPLSPMAYTGAVRASATSEPTVRAPSSALLREPLTWAAIAVLLGIAVALAGTLSWLGWESVLGSSPGPIPVPPWLALWGPPTGDLLAALSLLGVYRLLDGRSLAAGAGGARVPPGACPPRP